MMSPCHMPRSSPAKNHHEQQKLCPVYDSPIIVMSGSSAQTGPHVALFCRKVSDRKELPTAPCNRGRWPDPDDHSQLH